MLYNDAKIIGEDMKNMNELRQCSFSRHLTSEVCASDSNSFLGISV